MRLLGEIEPNRHLLKFLDTFLLDDSFLLEPLDGILYDLNINLDLVLLHKQLNFFVDELSILI